MPRVLSTGIWNTPVGHRFWVNLGQYALFEVTAVSAGGGAGAIVYVEAADETIYFFTAPNLTNVVKVFDDNTYNYAFALSTDQGAIYASPSYSNTFDVFAIFFEYWQMLFQDLSNGQTIFGSIFFFDGNNRTRCFATADGGNSWNVTEWNPGFSNTSWGVIGIPRHNDTDGFFISTVSEHATTDFHVHIERVANDGSVSETYDLAVDALVHTTPNGHTSGTGAAFRACVKYANPDLLFILTENSEGNVFQLDWSTKTLTNLGNWWSGHPHVSGSGGAVHKQILSTRAGTILIVDSWSNSGVGGPWLVIWRSTDDGATWTPIDLTSLIPSSRPGDTWDFIAVAADNMLFIAIEGSPNGYGLFSVDDGATWQATGNFIPMDDYGYPTLDICANGK